MNIDSLDNFNLKFVWYGVDERLELPARRGPARRRR